MKKFAAIFTSILAATTLCKAGEAVQLFNGQDLNNWSFFLEDATVDPNSVFSVQDGVINIKGQPFGYMYTKVKYEDFYLHAEWCYPTEPSNSGIFLYVQDPKFWPNAIECQLFATKAGDFVLLGGSDMTEYKLPEGQTERPKFPIVEARGESSEKPVGQWNSADIICKDGKITVFINGKLRNEGTSVNKSGHIGLQSEGGTVLFRNVNLLNLKD